MEGGPVFVGFVDGIMLDRRLVTIEAKLLATEDRLVLEGSVVFVGQEEY